MKKQVRLLIILVVVVAGCNYDKGELIYPPVSVIPAGCDTSAVKYSVDVVNILRTNCYICHSGSALAGAGYKLDTYSGVEIMSRGNKLVQAITHTGPVFTYMPQGAPKLAPCDIAKIRTWVRNGALNN